MHIGGAQELAKRIPIRHYIDHGPSVEEREQVAGFQTAYAALQAGAKHTVVAPGDRLPLRGVDWRIVSSAGKAPKTSLPAQRGVRQPKFATPGRDADRRNGQSVGSVIPQDRTRSCMG